MSGKYEKKKNKARRRKSSKGLWFVLAAVVLLFCAVLALNVFSNKMENPDGSDNNVSENVQKESEDQAGKTSFTLDNDLEVTKLGSYTGAYMEDGSDEIVTDVMMIIVKNNGESTLQYAEITLTGDAGEAVFKFSTLNPGDSVVVLEANRKPYENGDSYSAANAEHVVFFKEPITLHEDKLQIQPLDGGFNITNISDQDITGKITVYFKDSSDGMYYGGITYRGSITGGMKAGEIKQVMSENFSAAGSTVVFITITEE